MQVRIVELQVGVEVVGEYLVVTGDVLDDATTDAFEKALGNRLQRAVDHGVDVHGFMGQEEFNLRQHVVDRELVGVHKLDQKIDIERAAVKYSGEKLSVVHRGDWGEGIKHGSHTVASEFPCQGGATEQP